MAGAVWGGGETPALRGIVETGKIVLAEVATCTDWLGEKVATLEETAGVRVAFISRLGEAMLAGANTVLQEGDVLHVLTEESDLNRVASICSQPLAPGRGGH